MPRPNKFKGESVKIQRVVPIEIESAVIDFIEEQSKPYLLERTPEQLQKDKKYQSKKC